MKIYADNIAQTDDVTRTSKENAEQLHNLKLHLDGVIHSMAQQDEVIEDLDDRVTKMRRMMIIASLTSGSVASVLGAVVGIFQPWF